MALVKDIITLDGTAWIEIGAAFLAYFVLSFLWWGPVFGKLWAKQMGMDPDMKPTSREMGVAMALQVLSTFLIAFVLWHVLVAFTVDLEADAVSNPTVSAALRIAFYAWLGFFLPVQLGRVAWEKGTWLLVAINAGGQLVGLAAMGLVFALL